MNENQGEEKALIEYKEQKGLFQWLKSRFEKLKEVFKSSKNQPESKKESFEEQELSAEDLEVVEGGYPNNDVIDFEERKAKIDNIKPRKSWELTAEQLAEVKASYPKVNSNTNLETSHEQENEQELTEEELDNVIAGQPINDEGR